MSRMIQHLHEDLGGALMVSALIVVVLLAAELWKRRAAVPVEWTRKLAHVAAGLLLLPVPWLIRHPETMVVLGCGFFSLLWTLRWSGALESVHGVRRSTVGAYLFPLAVVEAFIASDGSPVRYAIPLAVLTLADSTAALVGQRFGRQGIYFFGTHRTVEGSATFFVVAFACVLIGLTVAGVSEPAARVMIALVVAVLVTGVEAVSVRGADNFFVPFVTGVALDRLLVMPAGSLVRTSVALALACLAAAIAVAWWARAARWAAP